ncbi:NDMA-dependent alcohol dehydrogenase [Streptomyces mexicanus]|jgi:alcohol dehydrogenase/S-(hydroxymethyl)glutathione dehydrogenase/alcohol dehydrogenase|uniref:NDMA-dependent alcohol dehydrogenase n=1 Tax=Streptomyces mexicanus TaxID=178566 RepID=A0A7X1LPL1_9ACTN|nr:NDMA-dependent alcohol dehydrogenase [Streptomyces mexicanus]MBC2864998.1 NDMA-dependent alcohol dehydrogenase [Streptomyces mexicanus]
MSVKTKAAVLKGLHQDFEVVQLDLEDPREGEVLVRMKVAGLCHSDKHVKFGGVRLPAVSGHEGAGIVEKVGPGVTEFAVGDHVAVSWIPECGRCKWCRRGMGNLCDLGAAMMTGELIGGGFRFRDADGVEYSSQAGLGTFSQYLVASTYSLVKVDPSIPWEWVSLVTCGVTTGWGSVVNVGKVKAGDSVAIYGCGGIGANAVQAAIQANAGLVGVIEPVEWKRGVASKWGADAVYATAEEAHADMWERTHGAGVDVSVITVGVVHADVVGQAFELTRKGGQIVLTGVSDDFMEASIQVPGSALTLFQKSITGSLFGACVPHVDVPMLLGMAKAGKLRLDELVTSRYRLDQVNQGFTDMLDGKNLRGVIVFDD